MIHNSVCMKDNERQYLLPQQYAENTSANRSQQRITHIFPCNRKLSVPQSFQRPNLRPLLLHHTRHSRKADKRRYQKEQHGKYLPDGPHAVCVFPISGMLRQVVPVVDIPFGVFDLADLILRVQDLLFPVRDLVLRFLLRLLVLLLGICQLLFLFRKLRPGIRKLDLPLLQLIPAVIDLSLGVIQLIPSGLDLLFPVLQLGQGVVQLRLGVLQLTVPVV